MDLAANDDQDAAGDSDDDERRFTRTLDLGKFEKLNWSPCPLVEDPSRWLALEPDCGYPRGPMLVDLHMSDHQQVTYLESLQEVSPGTTEPLIFGGPPESVAHWLEDGHCLLVHAPQADTIIACPHNTYKVDACSKTRCSVRLPGVNDHGYGTPHTFIVSSPHSPVTDIFCWQFRHASSTGVQEQIIAYDLCSRQPLYQISCPEQVLNECDQLHQCQVAFRGRDSRSSSQMREKRVHL